MYLTRSVLAFVFVLFASTALAAKPEKSLVCHVGSDRGSNDETYIENRDCTPPVDWVVEDDGEFICPDAGKVDLIAVSKKTKHVGNKAHYFMEEVWGFVYEDYYPIEGFGHDPADFEDSDGNGIDDGCELCPCAQDLYAGNYYPETALLSEAWNATIDWLHQAGYEPNVDICFIMPPPLNWRQRIFGWEGLIATDGRKFDFAFIEASRSDSNGNGGGLWSTCSASWPSPPPSEENYPYYSWLAAFTTLPQHNACVRLIDSEFGEPEPTFYPPESDDGSENCTY